MQIVRSLLEQRKFHLSLNFEEYKWEIIDFIMVVSGTVEQLDALMEASSQIERMEDLQRRII